MPWRSRDCSLLLRVRSTAAALLHGRNFPAFFPLLALSLSSRLVMQLGHFSRQKKRQCGADGGNRRYLAQEFEAEVMRFLAEGQSMIGASELM
jgi:hypothetical protein